MNTTTMVKKQRLTQEDYKFLQEQAIRTLKGKFTSTLGNRKDKVDIYLISQGNQIPTQVYIVSSWQNDVFPFPELTLPDTRVAEIQRGAVALFNRDLTRFILIMPQNIAGISPVNGKLIIPLNRITIRQV